MLKVKIVDEADKMAVCMPLTCKGKAILVENSARIYGTFKAETRTSAGTTIVAEPSEDGSIILTDIIVTADRVNGASVTVQFTDGTNTIVIFEVDVTDAPVAIGLPLNGRWQGWRNARLELVTVGAVTSTLSVGYYKIPSTRTLDYSTWDALR